MIVAVVVVVDLKVSLGMEEEEAVYRSFAERISTPLGLEMIAVKNCPDWCWQRIG